MFKPIKTSPECIYSNKCTMICINPSCRKPGFICEKGESGKTCCGLFHEDCEKMSWSQFENIICENKNTQLPEFYVFQEAIENFFTSLAKKVQREHLNFKRWAMMHGFSQETMNFINLINEGSFNNISGRYTHQILSALFMNENKPFDHSFNYQECSVIQEEIDQLLQRIKDLYQTEGKQTDRPSKFSASVTSAPDFIAIQSKIDKIRLESDILRSMFKQPIKKFTLLYRASENAFSVAQFHKACDEKPNTITVIETEYGNVIGGFTPLPWNSSKKHWSADKSQTSFIFSMNLRERYALNLAQFAIACNPEKGPIFGCCDICIVDKSNMEKSNAEFPISYNNFKYARNAQASTAFTGNAKGRFTTKQWEVFQVQFS